MTSRQSIFINSTPEMIFDYLMQIENRKSFIPALEDVILLDELPIRKGSRYIEVANIGGRRLETTYQVIDFEEDKYTVAKTLKSIFPIQAGLYLEKKENGTQLIISLDFQLKGIFKLAAPMVKGIVNQQAFGILMKIKENIEGK